MRRYRGYSDTKKSDHLNPKIVFSTLKSVEFSRIGAPLADVFGSLLLRQQTFLSLKPSHLLPRKPPVNKMAELTTHQITKPNSGETGSKKRPDILKEPQNIGLLAEARSDQTELNDAIQVVEGLLSAIEQVEHNALSTCMISSYGKMLSKEIDASETLLAKCQEKLNELTDIYSSFCSDTNQLEASISSCKRKLVKIKRRS